MNPLGMWTNLRSQIDSYTAVLGGRFISLIWVGAICALIWIFGPRLELFGDRPLESVRSRVIAIAVVVALWAIWRFVAWRRARKADAALIEGVAESPEARAAAETKEEIAELRNRLRNAMALMRKVVKRRYGYAYEFPWYLMMGAPGAGKTTLLTNSGLKFPLGDAMGAEPVQGVGGTKNCNWWFTDRAILIDTAGRYTTQESGHERDKAGFLGFLSMLRSKRRAQPINGVILTLSLTDLLSQAPEDRMREIRAIRQRLSEVEDTLKARVPVYLVLTKADKLTGFSQFFEALGSEGREQVWGMTFPLEETRKPGSVPEIFSREYLALQDRLNGLLIERLQQETDVDRRGRIFRFPAQVGALHDSLREMIEELSSGTSHIAEPLIRGVYFASATQETQPHRATGPVRSMNRSFFVSRLFSEVILGEAALVSRDHRVSRRRRIITGIGYGVTAALAVFLLGSWTSSYLFNREALARTGTDLARYTELAQNIPVRDVQDADFLRVLPALNTLSEVPTAFEPSAENGSFALPLHRVAFGLGQEARIVGQYEEVYDEALGAYLLPRYMVALQNRLKDENLSEADAFETLKHYLSLAGVGPIDSDALLAQAEEIFADLYPGSDRTTTRAALLRHMTAMLDRGELTVMVIDEDLVSKVRDKIRTRSPSQRAYDLLYTRPAARALGVWTPAKALGPAGARAFARASGTPMDEGINGLLTRKGYQEVVLTQITAVSEIAANEGWVRGPGADQDITASEIAADAVELYWSDFTDTWDDMVSDIVIRDITGLEDAAELVSLIASEANPIERLATDIARQTYLIGPPDIAEGAGEAAIAGAEALLVDPNLPFNALGAPDPYAALRRSLAKQEAVEGEEAGNAISALLPIMDEIYQQLNRVSATDAQVAELFAAESQLNAAKQQLVAAGRKLPAPVGGWVVGLAGRIASAAVAQARTSVDALWQANGAKECTRAVSGRYPFDRTASTEVTIDDFTRVFGPDGIFDSFFKDNLAGFVDVSTSPWRWKGGLGTTGEESAALAQFERAAAIRTAFFPPSSTTPQVRLTIDMISFDPATTSVWITIGDETSKHNQAFDDDVILLWPGETSNTARISLLPVRPGTEIEKAGPWAPFRLFDEADITPVSENEFDVRYQTGGRTVEFRVKSSSVNNPFRLEALSQFSCPDKL
ncbi:type VI secretion system membrane subunit TssM [Tabrizicola sp.]|uniref:type VI secretion system membrane subunit TssM n=1 Tax=Tabrizicola sp. TaxID=2005166 RepID=UPI003F3E6337